MASKWMPFATVPLLLVLLTACDLSGSRSYRLVLQLVEANGAELPDPRIEDVVEELRNTLPFEAYALKNEMSIAFKPGAGFGQNNGTDTGGAEIIYKFKGGVKATIQPEGRGDGQTLRLRIDRESETVLETTVGVELDQTLVLGSVPQTDGTTLLVVVRMIES